MKPTTQTLVISMENHAGALAGLVGLFAQWTINIDNLTVEPTQEDKTLSILTLTTCTEQHTLVLLAKQIDRLVDVVDIELVTKTVDVAVNI